jgi:diguanylate cyclase (GGDEF)-like protein
MPDALSSIHDLTNIAQAAARANDENAALDTVINDVSRALDTRACMFQRVDRGWMLVAQARGGLRLPTADLQPALDAVPRDAIVDAVDLRPLGESMWTSMTLDDPDGPLMLLLVAGDWTILDRTLLPFVASLTLAFGCVRERQARRRAERLLISEYTMARRLSRLGGVETVCQRIVSQVGRSIGADRVALAIYRAEDDTLYVAATYGYPLSIVKDVRIHPGSWVIGHVYSSGRPVLVPDVRRMLGSTTALERRPYRTWSFAAVPMFAGRDTLGVLCATDKRDGSAFTRQDALALRTFSVSSALALVAARNDSEMHRLAYAATVDSLTGLFNRPYVDARLHQEVERAKRAASSLTVLMADIDDFKTINDTYGHQIGDAVLKTVGAIFRSSVRVFDVCARYGGDEFAIVMPSADQASASASAERIRQRVSEASLRDEAVASVPRLTVSIGAAVIQRGDTPAELIRRADQCLYQAKAEGKNRVRMNAGPTTVRRMPLIGRSVSDPASRPDSLT